MQAMTPSPTTAARASLEDDCVASAAPAPYVTIKEMARRTGLSEKAIRRKIEEGVWLEGREWRRGPDGRLYISVRGYQSWVEGGASRPRAR